MQIATVRTARRCGVEEELRMSAAPLVDRGAGLPVLPALADQLADPRTLVLARFRQELLEAVLGFAVEPDGEWHGPQA